VFAVIALEAVRVDMLATQVVMLAPTREIAVQIHDVVQTIGAHTGVTCVSFIGGLAGGADIARAAKGCQIVVGGGGHLWLQWLSAWSALQRISLCPPFLFYFYFINM